MKWYRLALPGICGGQTQGERAEAARGFLRRGDPNPQARIAGRMKRLSRRLLFELAGSHRDDLSFAARYARRYSFLEQFAGKDLTVENRGVRPAVYRFRRGLLVETALPGKNSPLKTLSRKVPEILP